MQFSCGLKIPLYKVGYQDLVTKRFFGKLFMCKTCVFMVGRTENKVVPAVVFNDSSLNTFI